MIAASKPTILVIYNPRSGLRMTRPSAERLTGLFRKHPCTTVVEAARSSHEAAAKAHDAKNRGFDRIVAAGGDGTVSAVIAGTLDGDTKIPIGILPIGTGNLHALDSRISLYLPRAVATAVNGQPTPIDIGYVPATNSYLTLNGAIGYGASIVQDSPSDIKRWLGYGSYLFAAVKNMLRLKDYRVTVVVDGMPVKKKTHAVLILNRNLFRPPEIFRLGNIQPDDGMLDLFVIREATLLGWLRLGAYMLFRRYRNDPRILHHRGKRIMLHSHPDAPVQVDGELVGTTPITVEVIPRAIQIVVPREKGD